ncbi:binding--dependent transport system inner membrane component family protein [Acinetobacter baumannii 348935]|uniref:ABC transmembrane type-1 domain-containing protein n=1 Tax=Acinetobacter variabilis TaxID=70346 RepID=N9MHT4_9GAMM|nr:hypothetical protein F897_02541 [Acinetobacter variabilis]EXA66790.1 binding--dependent transport system inner membrane component family protein [Acinetobacter baumannii 348935]
MHDQLIDLLLTGTTDTLIMVGVSAIVAFLIGLPMAVVLVSTSEHGIYPSKPINQALGWVVNITRSVPFLILMVALIPITRWIVGTSYGVWAAVVPLTLAATPFSARIAEVSLREVDQGLIEAAQAIGCNRKQIIWLCYCLKL